MAAAQHKLSRRALLAGACALPLTRHSGLDPEPKTTAGQSTFLAAVGKERWIPDQVRDDEAVRREEKWQEAFALFNDVDRELEALVHCPNQRVYDRALGRHSTALRRLLRAPAPDLAAAGLKLELIVRHHVFEASFAAGAVASLRRDIGRFATLPSS
jgi:hypothetical protein